jgi:hypothetical protein
MPSYRQNKAKTEKKEEREERKERETSKKKKTSKKCLVDSMDAVIKNTIFFLSFDSNILNFIQKLLKYCEVIFGFSISVGFTLPVIGWPLLNIHCGHSGKHLDSADLPLELDTNLSILKVSNLNYLERRVQTLGGSCLHLQLLGVYKYGSPVPHTRERQKLYTGQQLDWTPTLS